MRVKLSISCLASLCCWRVGCSGNCAANVCRKVQVARPSSSLVTGFSCCCCLALWLEVDDIGATAGACKLTCAGCLGSCGGPPPPTPTAPCCWCWVWLPGARGKLLVSCCRLCCTPCSAEPMPFRGPAHQGCCCWCCCSCGGLGCTCCADILVFGLFHGARLYGRCAQTLHNRAQALVPHKVVQDSLLVWH